jgi:putative Holliday junction resolvase
MTMPKIMGIDYGTKRIGTALAETEIRIASPLGVVAGRNDVTRDARTITDLGESEAIGEFVVGLPLNMDGSDSAQTALTRRFAAELQRLSNKPVHLEDERLTSYAAGEVLDAAAVSPEKRKLLTDRIAAQKTLQAYLDRL